jgi:vitamin B12 transporter
LRASAGKSYRVPTFNELYWRDGGNPLLRPERSTSFDCGGAMAFGTVRLDASFFSIQTNDRIVWQAQNNGIWVPENIRKVSSNGIEAEMKWLGFGGKVLATVNSTWMRVLKESEDYPGDPSAGKMLAYVPRQSVNASISLLMGPVELYARNSWVSFRYTSETNDRYLPNYDITSAAISFSYPIGIVKAHFKLEATNLFNASYQVIALYPMPLREIKGTIGATL